MPVRQRTELFLKSKPSAHICLKVRWKETLCLLAGLKPFCKSVGGLQQVWHPWGTAVPPPIAEEFRGQSWGAGLMGHQGFSEQEAKSFLGRVEISCQGPHFA